MSPTSSDIVATPFGVGIVGAEDHPVLSEHAVEIIQSVTQERVVVHDLTVIGSRMIDL